MKIVIVGGVAGGASAAARIRRLDEKAEIILLERGEAVSYANCGLPYYIGGIIENSEELFLQTPESFWRRFRVQVRIRNEVVRINREDQTVTVRKVDTGEKYEESYDKLVLSPGGEAFVPPVDGAKLPGVYTLRTVEDTLAIRELAKEKAHQRVVVIGGGFIGLEVAENLRMEGLEVTIIEGADQIFPPFDKEMAAIAQKEIEKEGIRVVLDSMLKRISQVETGYEVETASGEKFRCDFVIMAIGIRPESHLAVEAGLEVNDKGGIVVDRFMRTCDENIYAAGDAVEVLHLISGRKGMLPLAGPANKQGRLIAANLSGNNKEGFAGVIGSSVVKLFGLTAACTGLNEKSLIAFKMPYEKIYLSPPHHAGYYPGGEAITIKLLFSPDGRVLGSQCIGREGVEKRVDVIATVIKMKGNVSDLAELELCYAPPYSSAKDPVNYAGFIAENVLTKRSRIKHWEDLAKRDPASAILIDVRTAEEYQEGHLSGSINIPVDELRERMTEIPEDKDLWIYCQVGLRGYIAQRILMQARQQKVFNLSGGYRLLQISGMV